MLQRLANDDFSYDLNEINSELTELNQIEDIILENNNKSIVYLNQEISENLSYGTKFIECNKTAFPMQHFSFEEMDWGAFAWGFVVAQLVFFTVGINKEKDSSQKAFLDRSWSQYTHQYNIKCDNLGSRRRCKCYIV